MARRRSRYTANAVDPDPIILLWLLRILVPLGGHRKFVRSHGFNNDTLAEVIGLGHWIDPSPKDFDLKAVQSELRLLHQKAEKQWAKASLPTCLRNNVGQLSDLVGLSATDCRILEFAVSIHNERLLDDTADWLGQISSVKVFHALSTILNLPEPEIRASLSAQGILARSGLVSVDRSGTSTLRGKLDLLSDGFADLKASSEADPISLLRGTVYAAGPSQLNLADYSHINSSLEILRPYLRHAATTGRRGVNIFLHGAPGTGKSQLARALADELGCELFEVASEDADGDPVNGERRLRAFRARHSLLSTRSRMSSTMATGSSVEKARPRFGRRGSTGCSKRIPCRRSGCPIPSTDSIRPSYAASTWYSSCPCHRKSSVSGFCASIVATCSMLPVFHVSSRPNLWPPLWWPRRVRSFIRFATILARRVVQRHSNV